MSKNYNNNEMELLKWTVSLYTKGTSLEISKNELEHYIGPYLLEEYALDKFNIEVDVKGLEITTHFLENKIPSGITSDDEQRNVFGSWGYAMYWAMIRFFEAKNVVIAPIVTDHNTLNAIMDAFNSGKVTTHIQTSYDKKKEKFYISCEMTPMETMFVFLLLSTHYKVDMNKIIEENNKRIFEKKYKN